MSQGRSAGQIRNDAQKHMAFIADRADANPMVRALVGIRSLSKTPGASDVIVMAGLPRFVYEAQCLRDPQEPARPPHLRTAALRTCADVAFGCRTIKAKKEMWVWLRKVIIEAILAHGAAPQPGGVPASATTVENLSEELRLLSGLLFRFPDARLELLKLVPKVPVAVTGLLRHQSCEVRAQAASVIERIVAHGTVCSANMRVCMELHKRADAVRKLVSTVQDYKDRLTVYSHMSALHQLAVHSHDSLQAVIATDQLVGRVCGIAAGRDDHQAALVAANLLTAVLHANSAGALRDRFFDRPFDGLSVVSNLLGAGMGGGLMWAQLMVAGANLAAAAASRSRKNATLLHSDRNTFSALERGAVSNHVSVKCACVLAMASIVAVSTRGAAGAPAVLRLACQMIEPPSDVAHVSARWLSRTSGLKVLREIATRHPQVVGADPAVRDTVIPLILTLLPPGSRFDRSAPDLMMTYLAVDALIFLLFKNPANVERAVSLGVLGSALALLDELQTGQGTEVYVTVACAAMLSVLVGAQQRLADQLAQMNGCARVNAAFMRVPASMHPKQRQPPQQQQQQRQPLPPQQQGMYQQQPLQQQVQQQQVQQQQVQQQQQQQLQLPQQHQQPSQQQQQSLNNYQQQPPPQQHSFGVPPLESVSVHALGQGAGNLAAQLPSNPHSLPPVPPPPPPP